MEAKKILAKYVKVSPIWKILGWLFLLLGILCLCAGFSSGEDDAALESGEFYPVDGEIDSYCYIDAVGISPWLFQYDGDTYYAVEDAQGYNYILRVPDWKELASLPEQEEYWARESDEVSMPEAYRFQGLTKPMGNTATENLADVLGTTMVTFQQYFGNCLLDAGETPTSDTTVACYLLGFVLVVLGIIMLMVDLGPAMAFKRSLRRLEETGRLEEAARELEMARHTVGKNRGRLGSHFLYGRHTGMVVSYDDITWAYRYQATYAIFVALNTRLVIRTLGWNGATAINFGRKDKYGELDQVLAYISAQNPETFLGYSQQNAAAYNEKRREAKGRL